MFITLFKTLLLPPAIQLLMIVFAWLYWRRSKLLARLSLSVAVSSLLLLSLPIVSQSLFIWLESPFVKQVSAQGQLSAGAVVVLGGGRLRLSPEFEGKDQLSHQALWRLRYGAYLARKLVDDNGSQLPIVVSGGTVRPYETVSEAAMAAGILEREFFVQRVLQETQSRDTWQNAIKTAALLKQENISTVLLVTHAYHMRRAQYSFKQAGVDVIPMATGFFSSSLLSESLSTSEPWYGWWDAWIPTADALNLSSIALHEYLGLVFYEVRQQLRLIF